MKIEELSSEEQKQKEDRGGKRMSKLAKPKEVVETSPQNQQKPQSELATKKILSSNKESQPSLLDQASVKSLEEEDHKDVPRHFKS